MLLGPDCGWRGQFLPAPTTRPYSVHSCQIEGGATSTVQHSREEGSVPALFRVSIPSDDAFVCSIHIVVNSPRQCGSGTTSNGATENAAGFSESLRNCSFGGCTWRRPLTRACKCTCVHACTLRVIEGKQPRLEHHVCDLCSPSLLLLPCFW